MRRCTRPAATPPTLAAPAVSLAAAVAAAPSVLGGEETERSLALLEESLEGIVRLRFRAALLARFAFCESGAGGVMRARARARART